MSTFPPFQFISRYDLWYTEAQGSKVHVTYPWHLAIVPIFKGKKDPYHMISKNRLQYTPHSFPIYSTDYLDDPCNYNQHHHHLCSPHCHHTATPTPTTTFVHKHCMCPTINNNCYTILAQAWQPTSYCPLKTLHWVWGAKKHFAS